MAALDNLPMELTDMILQYCDLRSMARLRQTNSICYNFTIEAFFKRTRFPVWMNGKGLEHLVRLSEGPHAHRIVSLTLCGIRICQIKGVEERLEYNDNEAEDYLKDSHVQTYIKILQPSRKILAAIHGCLQDLPNLRDVDFHYKDVAVETVLNRIITSKTHSVDYGQEASESGTMLPVFMPEVDDMYEWKPAWSLFQVLVDIQGNALRCCSSLKRFTCLYTLSGEDQGGTTICRLRSTLLACPNLVDLTICIDNAPRFGHSSRIGEVLSCLGQWRPASLQKLTFDDTAFWNPGSISLLPLDQVILSSASCLQSFSFRCQQTCSAKTADKMLQSLLRLPRLHDINLVFEVSDKDWFENYEYEAKAREDLGAILEEIQVCGELWGYSPDSDAA